MTTTNAPFPEVPAHDVADAIVRAHANEDPLVNRPGSGRFLRSATVPGFDADASTDAAEVNAAASDEAAAGRPAVAPKAVFSLGANVVDGGDAAAAGAARRAPRTIERALLELALIPEAGWPVEQADAFRDAAKAGSRTPGDVVQLVGFLRSWNALPKTRSAAKFACDLLASKDEVSDLEQSVGGVWSYSRRQARELRAAFEPVEEARLVRAALARPRPGKLVLHMLDAVDNEGGFSRYRPDLRMTALDAALRSDASAQDALQWALDARSIGIDDEADVAVFVRLLTQH